MNRSFCALFWGVFVTQRSRTGRTSAARRARWGLAALAFALIAGPARADTLDPAPHDSFRAGADALVLGKYEVAIAELEAHADREPPHPDASFDRALAYLARVRSGGERAGDLGRAAAALEETRLMRPDDAEAATALELVRAEVARRRARSQKSIVMATPSLDRLVYGLATPHAWAIAAILSSWLVAVGVLLRRRPAGARRLAGTLLIPVAAVLMVVLVPLAVGSAKVARSSVPGVLVVREAFLTDETGAALGGDPVLEAARLELGEERNTLVHVRNGVREGWLPAENVRTLRTR
ncbi:MAG: hypothetical protein EXR75_01880 [Myxococcales bacterium]|nr:hypothetical protein [Myxococcales bacterium]